MAWPEIVGVVRFGRERMAVGHEELESYQVEAGHHLGDRVLDLKAGVRLQEEELPFGRQQELHGACAEILDRQLPPPPPPLPWRHVGRRRQPAMATPR